MEIFSESRNTTQISNNKSRLIEMKLKVLCLIKIVNNSYKVIKNIYYSPYIISVSGDEK